MLKVSGLTVRYNRKNVLQSLNWQWPENVNCIALVGENGSGKSTLIKAITGLTAIVAGEIIFNKNEIANIPTFERIKRGISVLPQNNFFIPELTLGENLNIIKSPKVRRGLAGSITWAVRKGHFDRKAGRRPAAVGLYPAPSLFE